MISSNKLGKDMQVKNGKGAQQKGDWCELIAAAYFRKNNYLVYTRMSGETRYIDVKYKNTRQGSNTKGRRINRSIKTPLKNFIKIEIIYVDDNGDLEQAYSKGAKKWHEEFEIDRDEDGCYNGKIKKKH